jgi:HK97 family phage major capsid protein
MDRLDPTIAAAFDAIEKSIETFATKAQGEAQTVGKVSKETADALVVVERSQVELADRLLKLEQSGGAPQGSDQVSKTWGEQFVGEPRFKAWQEGQLNRFRLELKGSHDAGERVQKNTIVTADAIVAPDRRPGVLPGAFQRFVLEDFLGSRSTTSSAVEYTREASFTNAAAEVAEAASKAESALTFELVSVPLQTVAHWIKISRQLSMDATALVAYINNRMRYGVNKRVEDQLIAGNGTTPNISGLLDSGNYTAHGYTAAALTALGVSTTVPNRMVDLIALAISAAAESHYPADFIIMNPADWTKISLAKDGNGMYLIGNPQTVAQQMLWGLPVVTSMSMTADNFLVMSRQAATVINREGVVVEMSDSDSDNFTKNLITIRAERRLALATEIPAAIRGGDLSPA